MVNHWYICIVTYLLYKIKTKKYYILPLSIIIGKSTNKKLYDSSKVSLKYLDMFYKHRNIFEKINKGNIKVIKETLSLKPIVYLKN